MSKMRIAVNTLALGASVVAAINLHSTGKTMQAPAAAGAAAAAPAAGAAPAPAAAAPTPAFNSEVMPPTPVAIECILNLAVQYFVVYTALALFRAINQYNGSCGSLIQLANSAATTVNYCPMLAVLFLAVRMRAEQLTQGRTEEFQVPDSMTQTFMRCASWSVLAQVLIVLVVPVFTGELNVPTDEDGNVDLEKVSANLNKNVTTALNAVKWAILVGLYGCTGGVVYGIWAMEAPKQIYPGGTPVVSPAIGATVNLASQFFAVYILQALVKTIVNFQGPTPALTKLSASLNLATYTLNLAPMLSILFIGARMRALSIDPTNGAAQAWAQNCFYLCAFSVLINTLLVVVTPYCSTSIKAVKGDFEGDVKFEGASGPVMYALVSEQNVRFEDAFGNRTDDASMKHFIVLNFLLR